jgi:hypothetical protein
MAPVKDKKKLFIARDASDLAFRMGQAVQRALVNRAFQQIAARNETLVRVADVEAATTEFNLATIFGEAGDPTISKPSV